MSPRSHEDAKNNNRLRDFVTSWRNYHTMSLLDELQREVAKRDPLKEKRAQIAALRDQAQAAFKTQFLLSAGNPEKIAFLQGRIAAQEC